ncbi:MAG: hypothetical protein MPEBLZ_00208 [Candidatus Methanoperedens nitroreducens]|uniref:Uncharacterized protein n=1 Tax=Candidatus Methanoperedens nitratireducens TaxID=1392998 RepID=A0A0N8KRK4_9EURY|nr:hypothetical protein [Candidatus Methanoperedens sp. BLZ2]KAB2947065.1 MAG: hypothetical protein F9K14_04905 [Candidatus Methanoperedens sp.]KPQ45186.1 MAG: hypothetical protein MPEBLZ_00208 [Candidatus Methanoperedens sp. BLZ1]MBZ0174158.1 hypothetical protein [Candidatus Methanoperedens nitroreducens]CAG0958352.1 hypothetical protein METP2_00634 [Methanosarcinales archaeon]MCX9077677.1 hypothetical protein [Candidatus Methanoperedens sp.]
MIKDSNAEKIAKVFSDYCKDKNYHVKKSEDSNDIRLEISNIKERTIVNIYHTSKILIQGLFIKDESPKIKACSTRYDIMLSELRTEIKQSLNTLGAALEITDNQYKTNA